MKEICTGKPGATLPPIQIQPPSMGSVLDMLNVINGILFVQIRYLFVNSCETATILHLFKGVVFFFFFSLAVQYLFYLLLFSVNKTSKTSRLT